MEWLLADDAQPALGVAGLTLAGLLLLAAAVMRRRSRQFDGRVFSVFLGDAATVAAVLAVTLGGVSGAVALGIDGIGSPVWLLAVLVGLAAAAALLAWRWNGHLRGEPQRIGRMNPTGAPERRLVSTAWEIGIVVAGGAGLLTYIGSADHRFGHPLHWLLALVGVLTGYALGIGATTPRFRLQAPTRT